MTWINGLTKTRHEQSIKIPLDNYKPLAYIKAMTNTELKNWREREGYSQGRLAEALGIHVMTVSKWERGIRAIPPFLRLALRALELGGAKDKQGDKTETKTERS